MRNLVSLGLSQMMEMYTINHMGLLLGNGTSGHEFSCLEICFIWGYVGC